MKTNAKKSVAEAEVRVSENEIVKQLAPELSPAEKAAARVARQLERLAELEKRAEEAKIRADKKAQEFAEKQAKAEQREKDRAEKQAKLDAEKAAKKAARAESATPWGSTVEIMCATPDLKFDELIAQLKDKGVDVIKSKSTIHTTYAYTRRVVSLLRENGLMAKAS